MPGYGASRAGRDRRVALDVQGHVLAELLDHWDLDLPHVIAHDYGGAVSLRAHLLENARYASLALVNVVALAPWARTSSASCASTGMCSAHCPPPCTRAPSALRRRRQPRRPHDRAHRLAELIPGSRLELIAGAGHLIQLDQPVALATTLHDWLTRQGAIDC